VDFNFYEGEVVSIVGRIGQWGKPRYPDAFGLISTTEARLLQGKKRDISTQKKRQEYWKKHSGNLQDPFSSYNIFRKIDSVLLIASHARRGNLPRAKKVELMTEACGFVNLKFEELTNKYPLSFPAGSSSDDDCPHLSAQPKILLADEPTRYDCLFTRDHPGRTDALAQRNWDDDYFHHHDIGLATMFPTPYTSWSMGNLSKAARRMM